MENLWQGIFGPYQPVYEPGDLIECVAELTAERVSDGKICTAEEIEQELGVQLPRLHVYYFTRDAYIHNGQTYVRLEELVNPILEGNDRELSFHYSMFRKVDSVHNKINIDEL